MIARIEGTIRYADADSAIVDVTGVGYQIFTTPHTLSRMAPGEAVVFFTYMAVRENAIELFGFSSMEEKQLFELLLSVSGIGPRSALSILGLSDPSTIIGAINRGESAYLTTVSGIGRKTAEKIVLELREKVAGLSTETDSGAGGDIDAIEALKSLGYSVQESRDALREVDSDVTETAKRITEALKYLGR